MIDIPQEKPIKFSMYYYDVFSFGLMVTQTLSNTEWWSLGSSKNSLLLSRNSLPSFGQLPHPRGVRSLPQNCRLPSHPLPHVLHLPRILWHQFCLLSSARRLGCFWAPPPALWLGNCLQAVTRDGLSRQLGISFLSGTKILYFLLSNDWKRLFEILCLVL